MSKRKFGSIKSLLHFDYPYFNEPNDGLGDEIGLETWTNSGATLRGSVIPKAGTYAPKFGYRCLYTKKTCILGSNDTGIWNIDSDKQYEVGMFINAIQIKYAQNILSLMDTEKTDAVLQLSINAGGTLCLEASGFGISSTSGNTIITIKSWNHILMRVSGNKIRVFLNGKLELSASLPSNTVLLGLYNELCKREKDKEDTVSWNRLSRKG